MHRALFITSVLALFLIAGCQSKPAVIGGDKDVHGCLAAAGYSWCDTKQKCLRTWEENCTAQCGACPLLTPPSPTFCTNGTIIDGGKDDCGCQLAPKCERAQGTELANPASTYCIQHGGTLRIVTAADGSQTGMCTLPGGSQCDEWAYFRGQCPK
jgi:putative hemolysin